MFVTLVIHVTLMNFFGLIEWCLQESKLSVVCEKVMDRCLAPNTAGGEGCDNMTMILVQFKKTTESSGTSSEVKSEEVQAESKTTETD